MIKLLPRFAVPAALISIFAVNAWAQSGCNLSWGDCGSFGTADKTSLCNSNTGTNSLYVSFVPPAGVDSMVSLVAIVDITSSTGLMPSWWDLATGGCRGGKISCNADFSANVNCVDYWGGTGTAALLYQSPFDSVNTTTSATALNVNHARVKGVCGVASTLGPVDPTMEFYAVKLNISNALTTGVGSCAGCTIPMCLVLNMVALSEPAPVPDFLLTAPPPGGRTQVTWQGPGANCSAVPVKNKTWGQIKSLYR